jgi:inorganic pyrophosphatase
VALPESLAAAHEEILALRLELARREAQLRAREGASRSPSLSHRGITLGDGSTVDLQEDEVAAMREIFDHFDRDRSGTISTKELLGLHEKLGEPLTDAEAAEAAATIDPEGRGEISFDAFLQWWDGRIDLMNGDSEELADEDRVRWRLQYAERFKFVKAKLANPKIARITTRADGVFPSLDYRVRFFYTEDDIEKAISPWHNVPLKVRWVGFGGEVVCWRGVWGVCGGFLRARTRTARTT